MDQQKPREIAVNVLRQRETVTDYVETLLENELAHTPLSPVDRGLCQELVYGIVRWQTTLDWLIARKTEGREQKPALQILLRLGLYQMFWLDRVPNHAAVHETVELAKSLGFGPQAGFVNAVLRGYTRERVPTEELLRELKARQPHLGFSHPEWLCQRWLARWGAEKTAQLLGANNTPPTTFARLNTLKTDAAALAAQWQKEGVKFAARSWDWTGDGLVFQLESHPPLAGLRSFKQGWFYVQDPSTLLAVQALDPQPGESVLDLCAAPGGKTTFIAQRMQNRGKIFAQDNQPERLALIHENCARLGVSCVEISVAPNAFIAHPAKRFDRVLVDAPCSNRSETRAADPWKAAKCKAVAPPASTALTGQPYSSIRRTLTGSLALAALTSLTLSSGSTTFEVGVRPSSHSTASRNPAGLRVINKSNTAVWPNSCAT